jgi:DNA-binding transcriptional MerR regulator
VPERSHLSIGEVLSLLRDEFPDVTISKIRFLESQGLVDPERTPSGYRKFYEPDVERLRWILRQQREHFLPLKVIRGRLTEQEGGDAGTVGMAQTAVAERETQADLEEPAPAPAERALTPTERALIPTETAQAAHAYAAGTGPVRAPARQTPPTPSLFAGLHGQPAAAAPAPAQTRPAPHLAEDADTYTVEELAAAVGTDAGVIQELKQYGLIAPHAVVAGVPYYDTGAMAVSVAAAAFARHGVEARHLRMWRNAADREADLFQQVVLPFLRQRNPQARRQALDTLSDLAAAGAALRAALVERAVRDIR